MRVLVACEYSGVVRDAFRARGHDAWSCDLLPTEGCASYHIQGDVRKEVQPGRWDLMIAHPDCTRLTNAGVRWLHKPPKGKTLDQMWSDLYDAVEFYRFFREAAIPKKAIENPVMHQYARWMTAAKDRQVVQPWYFGEEAFKATGFELIGLPELEDTNRLNPPKPGTEEHKKWSFIHRASPGPDRWKLRSRTFPGIADAMADQWGK